MKTIMFLRRLAAVLTLYPTTFVHFGVGAQQKPEVAAAACQVEEIKYMGWQAQQVSNPWVKLFVCESAVCRETSPALQQRMV